MRILLAVVSLAMAVSGCTQPAPSAEVRSVTSGMMELPLGQPLSGPLGDPDSGPVAGTAYYQLPMTGALVTTFYDFSAEIEVSSGRLIAVSARRTLPSFADCQKHLSQVTQALSAKYGFTFSEQDSFDFDKSSGPIRAAGHCSTGMSLVNSTLYVRVSDRALSQASEDRMNQHFAGRASDAASASPQP